MAFLNYLSSGTYSVVDSFVYDKIGMAVTFQLYIFTDSTKKNLLASKQYQLAAANLVVGVQDFEVTEPPVNAVDGHAYFLGNGCTGVWEGYDHTIAFYENGSWTHRYLGPDEPLYDISEDAYYLNDGTGWSTVPPPSWDVRVWDTWFSSSVVFSDNTNIYKQAYLWLKTQPGFENVQDA